MKGSIIKRDKGFTLIELLAVIVILAIIALIAIPSVLNIIENTRKESAEISVQMYLRAVKTALYSANTNDLNIKLDDEYEIIENGKSVKSKTTGKIVIVEYDGNGLTQGTIIFESGEVKKIKDAKIYDWYAVLILGRVRLFEKIPESTLITGGEVNKLIKQLANESNSISSAWTTDINIKSIEFLSYGKIPEGYTFEELQKLKQVDVSREKNGTILALYDETNNKSFIYSENLILFNLNSDAMFTNFKALESLRFGEIDTSNVTTMGQMFSGLDLLKELDLSNFDTSNVTGMIAMFQGSKSLIELDLSNFKTTNVTTMQQMFYGCSGLQKLDMSSFNTSNVINMGSMFYGLSSLTALDLSSFKTHNVKNMGSMFENCGNLKGLDLSNFDTSKVTNMYWMFRSTSNLKDLNISEFTFNDSVRTENMFAGANSSMNIIVGGTSEKELIESLHTTATVTVVQ